MKKIFVFIAAILMYQLDSLSGEDIGRTFPDVSGNCGIISLAMAFSWGGADNIDVQLLIKEIVEYMGHDRVLSMEEIGVILEGQGLYVQGLQEHNLQALCNRWATDEKGLILAIKGSRGLAHFVFAKRSKEGVAYYELSGRGDVKSLDSDFLGSALVITRPPALRFHKEKLEADIEELISNRSSSSNINKGEGGALRVIELKEVANGEIVECIVSRESSRQGELSQKFLIKNSGDSDVNIELVKGDCGCFKNALYPNSISRHSSGQLELIFSEAKFKFNSTPRVVLKLGLLGGNSKLVVFECRRNLRQESNLVRSLPSVIYFPKRIATDQRRKLTVFVPGASAGVLGKNYHTKTGNGDIEAEIVDVKRVSNNIGTLDKVQIEVVAKEGALVRDHEYLQLFNDEREIASVQLMSTKLIP